MKFDFLGKLLRAKRPHLFCTPCVVHCLDLMLGDIGKIVKVTKTIQRGIILVFHIYNYPLALNTVRKFIDKTNWVRYEVTRFFPTFIMLQRLHDKKNL